MTHRMLQIFAAVALLGPLSLLPATAQEPEKAETASEESPALKALTEQTPLPSPQSQVQSPEENCSEGVVLDDGSVEGGYGFVPTLSWGTFIQRFDTEKASGKKVRRVCVCLLSSRVDELDFEVVFHKEVAGRPVDEPYARFPGRAVGLPNSVKEAGRFYPVDVPNVEMPEGASYVGIRWDPKRGNRAFLCSSKGVPGEVENAVPGFQRDNLSKTWDDVLNTKDRTFFGHESAMIRLLTVKEDTVKEDTAKEDTAKEDKADDEKSDGSEG